MSSRKTPWRWVVPPMLLTSNVLAAGCSHQDARPKCDSSPQLVALSDELARVPSDEVRAAMEAALGETLSTATESTAGDASLLSEACESRLLVVEGRSSTRVRFSALPSHLDVLEAYASDSFVSDAFILTRKYPGGVTVGPLAQGVGWPQTVCVDRTPATQHSCVEEISTTLVTMACGVVMVEVQDGPLDPPRSQETADAVAEALYAQLAGSCDAS